jgi:hypothetical protein
LSPGQARDCIGGADNGVTASSMVSASGSRGPDSRQFGEAADTVEPSSAIPATEGVVRFRNRPDSFTPRLVGAGAVSDEVMLLLAM